jgi:site-specific DNA-methyltransferase (adenine-specific)
LRALPAASIDLLVTDPPYATVDRSSTSGAHLQRWFRGSIGWPEIGRTLRLARSRLKPTGVALVMTNQAGLEAALHAMRAVRFIEPVRIITWDRQYPGLGGGLRHQTEYVLVGRLPASRPLSGVDLISVPAVGPGTADRYPTEKPEQLGRELARIAGIRRGDVVVDPFVGSGALLVGAFERGANVVGADISARAIERATERLRGQRLAEQIRTTTSRRNAARPRKAQP